MTAGTALLERVVCPHCWNAFAPEDAMWVSAHSSLLGDTRLGPDRNRRFLPSRFDVAGNAIDPMNVVCRDTACPMCHLGVPRPLFETSPYFVSILGTPAAGKSFYLAAMLYELRNKLPEQFAISFSDADSTGNRIAAEYEEQMFLHPKPKEWVALGDLIRKTEESGDLYDTVVQNQQTVQYPRPFLYAMRPDDRHPNYAAAAKSSRVVCLYDNAGESFLTGKDLDTSPVTRHLTQANLILFVYDPTQERRMREELETTADAADLIEDRSSPQERVLTEAIQRIRRLAHLGETEKHNRPLVVVVTKQDVWGPLLGETPPVPWKSRGSLAALDVSAIQHRSNQIKEMLKKYASTVVNEAERSWSSVTYIGVSALGTRPIVHPKTGKKCIRPADIKPNNVTTPLLFGMAQTLPGLIATVRKTT